MSDLISKSKLKEVYESMMTGIWNERESISKSARLSLMRWVIDKLEEVPEVELTMVKLPLRGKELNCTVPYFEGAEYVCIDTMAKIDTGIYGEYWYE